MREEMDRLFSETMNRIANDPGVTTTGTVITFSPRINVKEDEEHYIVTVDLPGASEADLSVKVEGGLLTVRAKRDTAKEDQSGARFLRRERFIGEFSRTVQLPGPVDESDIKTSFENGVLTVKLPKAADKNIQVGTVR
jgi:HSP20 family protein